MTEPKQLSFVQSDTERNLIALAKSGDAVAFGDLYEKCVDAIFNYIYYRVGNQQDAEDLTAQTFQNALSHINDYKNRGAPFLAWLYRIAHNLVANYFRSQKRHGFSYSLEDVVEWLKAPKNQRPEIRTATKVTHEALLAAIHRLPADRQQLLLLKFGEELSNAEIGAIMGKSEGAIKALYHRTLVSLQEDLTARGFYD